MFLENVNTENKIIKFGLARTVMHLIIWGGYPVTISGGGHMQYSQR